MTVHDFSQTVFSKGFPRPQRVVVNEIKGHVFRKVK